MSEALESLWPVTLFDKKQTPLSILKEQASELKNGTKARLKANIKSETNDDDGIHHYFEIIAPRIEYAHQLFEVIHDKEMVYPATIHFSEPVFNIGPNEYFDTSVECSDDIEFRRHLKQVFYSQRTRAVISALLARIDES